MVFQVIILHYGIAAQNFAVGFLLKIMLDGVSAQIFLKKLKSCCSDSSQNYAIVIQLRIMLWRVISELCFSDSAQNYALACHLRIML